MNILCSKLYQEQLKSILAPYLQSDPKGIKDFKLYLDTVILNMPSKVQKYKKSIYFDDEDIKDIEHQGYTIPFVYDEINDTFLILGITEKSHTMQA
jgi:hypothetical protein